MNLYIIRKYCRKIHSHLSFIFAGIILTYAISGLTMNYLNNFNPQYSIQVENYKASGNFPRKPDFTKEQVMQLLNRINQTDNFKQFYYPTDHQMRIFLKDGSTFLLNLNTGEVRYEHIKKRPLFNQLSFLHYNPNQWWTYISDIFAISLMIITITGICMVNTPLLGSKGIELVLGISIPILFLILFSK